jgi:transcriptional regulator with XRE-family HTH domain
MAKTKDDRLVAVGKQIRKVRKEKGFAQESFAAAADIDRSYYGGVERGEKNLSTLNLIKIALALGVEVGDLFPRQELLRHLLEHKQQDQ